MDATTLPTRLTAAIGHASATHASLAAALDVARSTVTHWCTNRSEPDRATLEKIAAFLGVRVSWLAFGDGPMTDDATAGDASSPAPSDATATAADGTPTLERRTRTRATKTASGKGSAAV